MGEIARHRCQELLSLLLANGAKWDPEAPAYAAKHGHWALAEWLLQLHRQDPIARPVCYTRLLEGAAAGCDLLTLKHAHALLLANPPPPPSQHVGPVKARSDLSKRTFTDAVTAASSSSTHDWREKVAWLTAPSPAGPGLKRVCDGDIWIHLPEQEALARVRWLTGTASSPLELDCTMDAIGQCAAKGRVACLRDLIELGAPLDGSVAEHAVEAGQLAALQLLHAHGCPLPASLLGKAAQAGGVEVLRWLAGVLGPGELLAWGAGGEAQGLQWYPSMGTGYVPHTLVQVAVAASHLPAAEWLVGAIEEQVLQQQADAAPGDDSGQGQPGRGLVVPGLLELPTLLVTRAAEQGRLDLVCWLHGRGCVASEDTAYAATAGGSVEVLEWLLGHGCPFSVSSRGAAGLVVTASCAMECNGQE